MAASSGVDSRAAICRALDAPLFVLALVPRPRAIRFDVPETGLCTTTITTMMRKWYVCSSHCSLWIDSEGNVGQKWWSQARGPNGGSMITLR